MTDTPQHRNGAPNTVDAQRHMVRGIFRFIILVAWLAILAWIVVVFFGNRSGFFGIPHTTSADFDRVIFPLIGLIAFFLVWTQVMIGSLRPWWQQLFPGIVRWHRRMGIFVLLFALLHPLLLISGIGLVSFFHNTFIPHALVPWIWVGEAQLFLIFVTTLTALTARIPWLQHRWRLFHMLNYVIFCLIWLHSWFLGTDVAHTQLRLLWFFYAATFGGAVTVRIIHSLNTRVITSTHNNERNTV